MSGPVEDTITPAAGPRSRAWVGRAVFEAGLIVLGIVGALVVDEWRDARQRRERVETALASIRTELDANRTVLRRFVARNEEVEALLRQSAETGRPYQQGLVGSLPAGSIAWSAMRDAGTATDIEHELLVVLGRAYDAVTRQAQERQVFLDYVYTYDDVRSIRDNPLRLAGWLSDITQHARNAEQEVDNALKVLDARTKAAGR
jgi:hypothetical protein